MAGRRFSGGPATVRMRLTVLAAIVVGVGLVAGGAVVLALVRHNLIANAHNDALHQAQATVALLAAAELPETLPSTGAEEATVVQVVDRDGRVISASGELRGKGPLVSRWPDGDTLTATLRNAPIAEGGDYAVVGLATTRAGEPVAVYAASSLEPVAEGVGATAAALAVVVPVLLVAVTGTAWLLVGRALRPVEDIRRRVAEITANELDRRVPEPATEDEVGRLARTMNEMLARLQQAHERQRRFVGDASHELRSPLATIRTRLEVGLAHPADTDWVRLAQTVHREGVRLGQLVDDLLLLARTERADSAGSADLADSAGSAGSAGSADEAAPRAGEVTPREAEPVDLDELVLLEVEAVRARGKVTVELAPFSAARLLGRPIELRRVVCNLLDNAERHATQAVVVSLLTDDGEAELVVADDGDGIPPAYAERVFERFFRLDPARDRDSGGAGLGLAIVRDAVASHGGRAWLAPTPGGAEFHVRLPLDVDAAPDPNPDLAQDQHDSSRVGVSTRPRHPNS